MLMQSAPGAEEDVSDFFAGAGGSTRGVKAAGLPVALAVNHWALAIHNHNKWNPEVDHDIADLHTVNPGRYRRSVGAVFSPECKSWSRAAPGEVPELSLFSGTEEEKLDRSRITMWDVLRLVRHHRYEWCVVENVLEVNAAKHRKNMDAWIREWELLGYEWQVVSLNALTTTGERPLYRPVPQSRDRWFFCAWRKGNRRPDLEFRPLCWCDECGAVEGTQTWTKTPELLNQPLLNRTGEYRRQYWYRDSKGHLVLPFAWPALSALDLGLPCQRIGDRPLKKWLDKTTGEEVWLPLAPATMRRIEYGWRLFGPSMVATGANTFERPPRPGRKPYYRVWPAWAPMVTRTATLADAFVYAQVSMVDYAGADDKRVAPTDAPSTTVVAQGNHQGVAAAPAFMVKQNGAIGEAHYRAFGVDEPLGTIVGQSPGRQTLIAVETAHSGSDPHYDANRVRSDDEPLPTQTATNTIGLVVPCGGSRPNQRPRALDEPHRTRTARLEDCVVIVPQRTGAHGAGADAPLGSQTGQTGAHLLITDPLVCENRKHGKVEPADEPLATLAAGGNHLAIVGEAAAVVRMNGDSGDAKSMTTPASGPTGTITGGDTQGVMPFVVPYNRTGEPVPGDAPIGTITGNDRWALVEGMVPIEDLLFRMLEPIEAGMAQGFDPLEPLEGNRREIVEMYGNAVPPECMAQLVARMRETVR